MKKITYGNKSMPYVEAVEEYVKEKRVPFHMPGHKQGAGMSQKLSSLWGKGVFKYDLSEVDGLDYLNSPSGVIKYAEDLASKAFHVSNTFFLINGTTVGNQASILISVREGEEIIIPRNSHQSVYSGLILSGARPVYVNPTMHKRSRLYPVIGPEKVNGALNKYPHTKAVHVTSPTHSGFTSNIKKIREITDRNNIPLIVDEAHGSHFLFHPELPKSAIFYKADIVLQSTHKTIGSLTQTSMLHIVNSKRFNASNMQSILRILQSSSPSTLLVMSLDAARQQMMINGKDLLTKTLRLARYARDEINSIPGFYCYGKEVIGQDNIYDIDETKLLIDVSESGYTGVELEKILGRKYKIEIEMSNYNTILCFVTIGDSEQSIGKLLKALKSLQGKHDTKNKISFQETFPVPELILTPREAFFAEKKIVALNNSAGFVSSEFIIPFPPDIPLIAPGERIDKDMIDYIQYLKKEKKSVIGPRDATLEKLEVIK